MRGSPGHCGSGPDSPGNAAWTTRLYLAENEKEGKRFMKINSLMLYVKYFILKIQLVPLQADQLIALVVLEIIQQPFCCGLNCILRISDR